MIVLREHLESLVGPEPAASNETTQPPSPPPPGPQVKFNLEGWVRKFRPEAKGPTSWSGGPEMYSLTCPWRPDDGSSAFVGRLASGAITAGCQHDSCPGSRSKGNRWRDLRNLLEGPRTGNAPELSSKQPQVSPLIQHDISAWGQRLVPPPVYLIDDQVPQAEPSLLVGPPNAGKGLLSIQEALAVAGGLGLFGKNGLAKPLAVILVQMEDSPTELERRIARALESHRHQPGWSPEVEADIRRRLVVLTPDWKVEGPKTLEALVPTILQVAKGLEAEGIPVGMIIIDTLAAVTEGDENSVEGSRGIWPQVYKLREETGANVTVVHHVRKGFGGGGRPSPIIDRLSPDSLRGSSAIPAGARSIRHLEPLKPAEAAKIGLDEERALIGAYAVLAMTKVVSGPKGSWLLLEMHSNGLWERHPDSDRLCAELRSKKAVADLTLDEAVLLSLATGITDRKRLGSMHWPNEPGDRPSNLLKASLNRLRNRHKWVSPGKAMTLTASGQQRAHQLSRLPLDGLQEEP